MKFLCGGCRTKYQISDEKIRGKILTIRCKKCGAKILVRESLGREVGGTVVAPIAEDDRALSVEVEARSAVGAQVGGSALQSAFDVAMHANDEADDMPTTIAPTPGNLEAAGVEWYVAIDGEQSGPFAFAELVRKVQAKEVIGRHYVWHDGMDGWKRVRDLPDLSNYLGSEKKKPPPLPPGGAPGEGAAGGAEVVDFASKRREMRRDKTGDLASGDIERESEEAPGLHESPTEAKVETKAPGGAREEQLDSVLNEALGIAGEGKTAKAGAVAVSATAGVHGAGHTPTVDDLSFGDDIFANVPRASAADVVVKESTRFFVAAAGVNRQKKRNKIAIGAGAFGVFMFLAFMGSWAAGVIQISIPGIGNPFNFRNAEEEEQAYFAELSAREAEELKKILDPAERKKRERQMIKRHVQAKVANKAEPGTPQPGEGGYIEDKENNDQAGTRGADPTGTAVQIDPTTGLAAQGIEVPPSQLPESGVENFPAVESSNLSQDTIGKVINDRKKSVSICYQQSLRGNEELRGKLEFLVTIEPSGAVSRANVETTAFKGTKLARCISSKIKEWRFPPFVGEPQQVQVPFVLEKNSY